MATPAPVRWYVAFFVVSGFASLVDEVVWLRLAMAAFGVTTPLVSIVLSVFMAGLALGSWGGGRIARRCGSPGRAAALYAAAELVIGVFALVVPLAFEWGRRALSTDGWGAWDSSGYYVASSIWVAGTLLAPCLAMGATFPLAIAALRRERAALDPGAFSRLYAANVLGATLGTVAAALVLIEMLGFRRTLGVSAALNLAVAAAVVLRAWRVQPQPPEPVRAQPAELDTVAALGRTARWTVLAWLFLSGLASMGMEIVWLRLVSPYLGTFVYTFALVLSVYLAATFVGSRIYRALEADRASIVAGRLWIAAGPLAVLPAIAADPRLPLPAALRLAGFVPFCTVVGFLTPMLVDRWSAGDPARAGRAYAANVVGSIAGPLLAGFWLLPRLDERQVLLALAVPLFAGGCVAALAPALLAARADGRRRGAAVAGAMAASVAVVAITHGPDAMYPQRTIRRDHTATVIAVGQGLQKGLIVNGELTTVLTPFTKVMAHLPLAALDRAPRNGLIICFGMGTTFRSMLAWDIPTTVVDLVPSVPLLFGYFHHDGPSLARAPLAHIVIDDGRRFLERSTERYDVITIDPPFPVEAAGSSLLYSVELYEAAKRRLAPDGILQQWIPGAEPAIIASVTRAIAAAFPHVRALPWIRHTPSYDLMGIHFLASMHPIPRRTGEALAARLPARAAADLVEWDPSDSPARQFDLLVRSEIPVDVLTRLAPSAPALSDDRPFNEYFLVRRTLLPF